VFGGLAVIGSSLAALCRRRPRPIGVALLASNQVVSPVLLEAGQLELAGPLLGVQVGRFSSVSGVS
jgi:hypothetical protein